MVDPRKYVVLDVETNGLNSKECDLLSISIFDPLTNEMYNRFLPLQLNSKVYTTHINGITSRQLKNQLPLTQEEWDDVVCKFNLENRTILIYTNFDERFIRQYFLRNKLNGYSKLKFYNFKRDLISYSRAEYITKDNLCVAFGIDGVQQIHSGENDCILEWKLFKKMDGKQYFVDVDKVYLLNKEYYVPASRLVSCNNFKYYVKLPQIGFKCELIYELIIENVVYQQGLELLVGLSFEEQIYDMLNTVNVCDNEFLSKNFAKLQLVGRLPLNIQEDTYSFNEDGTVNYSGSSPKKIKRLNETLLKMREQLSPLILKLKKDILKSDFIMEQETVINDDDHIVALCDISTDSAVVEIKTGSSFDINKYIYQLYYQSRGRDVYLLHSCEQDNQKIRWSLSKIIFTSDVVKQGRKSEFVLWKIVKDWRQQNKNGSIEECFLQTGISYDCVIRYWNRAYMSFDNFFETTEIGKKCLKIRDWRKRNPDGLKLQCSKECQIAYSAVCRYWDGYKDKRLYE